MEIVLCSKEFADNYSLMHYRTRGSKNGVRRYQYKDGSLTPEGYRHYGIDPNGERKAENDTANDRRNNQLVSKRERKTSVVSVGTNRTGGNHASGSEKAEKQGGNSSSRSSGTGIRMVKRVESSDNKSQKGTNRKPQTSIVAIGNPDSSKKENKDSTNRKPKTSVVAIGNPQRVKDSKGSTNKNTNNSKKPSGYDGSRYGKGNIDLNNRKVVTNKDGSISTERSFSVNIDGKETLLPTVIDGKIVDEETAIDHYMKTGEHLGRFDTVEEAEEYAQQLHERQDKYYNKKKK